MKGWWEALLSRIAPPDTFISRRWKPTAPLHSLDTTDDNGLGEKGKLLTLSCLTYYQHIRDILYAVRSGFGGQQIPSKDQNQRGSDPLTGVVTVSTAWYVWFLCAIELHCSPNTIKVTLVSHTGWVTCSFITLNTNTVVYFDSGLNTMCCCCKCSREARKIWIRAEMIITLSVNLLTNWLVVWFIISQEKMTSSNISF